MVKLFDTFEVNLPEYLNNQWAEFLILLALWMLIGMMVMLLIRVMTRLALRTEGSDVDDRVVQTLSGPVLLLVFGFGVIESMRVLDVMPNWLVDYLLYVYEILVAVIVVYLSYKIFRLVFIPMAEGVSKKRKKKFDRAVYDLF
ncbi:MAG: hypothetical protein KAQ96_07650, partial [Thermoplasmata archaeon]|nr:hypothetical protein [Thermoplasmata archaeon]